MKSLLFGRTLVLVAVCLFAADCVSAQDASQNTPVLGKAAKDFQLPAVAGEFSGDVKLSEVNQDGPVVLVVLRGFPGYQCPICSRQVGSLVAKADQFAAKNASVLLVYPGPAAGLDTKAKEFLKGSKLPEPFTLLLDPDYEFTNAYGLRWDAARETAYPSTFVIDVEGNVSFAKVSKGHGDRADADTILAEL